MKTVFDVTLKLRIAKDECQRDKFTKEFILEEMRAGNAILSKGSFSNFIVWKKNNNQVMAQVNGMDITA